MEAPLVAQGWEDGPFRVEGVVVEVGYARKELPGGVLGPESCGFTPLVFPVDHALRENVWAAFRASEEAPGEEF